MNNEINEEVKITEEKPKRSKKGLCIIAILALLVAAAICYIFIYRNNDKDDSDTNETNVKVLSESEYQDYINEYGNKVKTEAVSYFLDNGKYPKFEDIKDNIKTRRISVSCKKNIISVNGDIELSECSIEGYKYNSSIKYVYKDDNNIIESDNDSNSSLENGQPVIDEILTALKSSDVKVEKIYCSNCKDIKDEFDRNQLSCDTQKVLDTVAVEKLYNKVLTISKPYAYGTGWICEVYKLKITSNGKTYVLSMIDTGEILIGNENGVLYDAIGDNDNHEILEKEYADFFETL